MIAACCSHVRSILADGKGTVMGEMVIVPTTCLCPQIGRHVDLRPYGLQQVVVANAVAWRIPDIATTLSLGLLEEQTT